MTSLANKPTFGEREGVRPAVRPADAILAALRRAPAGMAVPARVGRYVFPGVPWAEKGYGFGGANCWGLACLFYREELGIALPRHEDAYQAALLARGAGRAELGALAAIVARLRETDWREIAFYEANLSDLMLLPIAGEPCHIAIYVGDLHILHIEEGCNAVCEDLREGRWHGRLRHARMFKYAGAAP